MTSLTTTLPLCNDAQVHYWQAPNGDWWETFSLPGHTKIDNEIIRPGAATQTPPAEVLANRGLCVYQEATPAPIAAQTPTPPLAEGAGGGALLLLVAIGGSAVWAYVQQRNDKGDFADDYHPMSDVPALPPVATNEDLSLIYDRVSYPQYQGIDEPRPFDAIELHPRRSAAATTTSPPVVTSVPPVTFTDFSTGDPVAGDALMRAREYFEGEALPAPRHGYSISAECLLNRGIAYQLVNQAVALGYSQNWISEYLFKATKGSQKYNLVRDMVNRCRGELSDG
jgi:hypothetical protein